MSKVLQRVLLVAGIIALIALIVEISLSLAATTHGNTPKKVIHVIAGANGAYPLTVNLYDYPANAGFALPFSITTPPTGKPLTFDVTSIPTAGVDATPVRASISPNPTAGGVLQGTAEIPVKGWWDLHIVIHGSQGVGIADIPILATAPPAMPAWLGWSIGFIPLLGLIIFLAYSTRKKGPQSIGKPQGQSATVEHIKEHV
jgi:hypothetical protein